MSEDNRRDDEQTIDIVYELPPSPEGTYQCEREDGSTVHGDASGEWTFDENGDADIVFFVSPGWIRKHRKETAE
jgi:hypothetical protein